MMIVQAAQKGAAPGVDEVFARSSAKREPHLDNGVPIDPHVHPRAGDFRIMN
jgi:hypothetical protein